MIKCPLCEGTSVKIQKIIPTVEIAKNYEANFQLDISTFFAGLKEVSINSCSNCSYIFYLPPTISGDGAFYKNLATFDWYYMPWKWEHDQAFRLINDGMKILEVGCGPGDFLKKISDTWKVSSVGLDLNPAALLKAKNQGINVIQTTIQEYAKGNHEQFDLVCSFQVLEHIHKVKDFLDAQIACLKKDGKLIISVPNYDSFLKLDDIHLLNSPPHHMGLWNVKCLSTLEHFFPLKFMSIHFEPLQDYHRNFFIRIMTRFYRNNFLLPSRIIAKILPYLLAFYSRRFKSFTIQAVYRKR